MKKQIIGAVFAVLVIVGLGLLIYSKNKTEEIDTTVFRDAFVEECSVDGGYKFCTCSYDALEDELGFDGFIDFALEYDRTGKLPSGTVGIIADCFQYLK